MIEQGTPRSFSRREAPPKPGPALAATRFRDRSANLGTTESPTRRAVHLSAESSQQTNCETYSARRRGRRECAAASPAFLTRGHSAERPKPAPSLLAAPN